MDEPRALKHASVVDLEPGINADAQLFNTSVHSIAWRDITVTVKDRKTQEPRNIVERVDGYVEAGKDFPTTAVCVSGLGANMKPIVQASFALSWGLQGPVRRRCLTCSPSVRCAARQSLAPCG